MTLTMVKLATDARHLLNVTCTAEGMYFEAARVLVVPHYEMQMTSPLRLSELLLLY
jgi:hypothetical protein